MSNRETAEDILYGRTERNTHAPALIIRPIARLGHHEMKDFIISKEDVARAQATHSMALNSTRMNH